MMVTIEFRCRTFMDEAVARAECEARVDGDHLILEKVIGHVEYKSVSGSGPLVIGLPWKFCRATGNQVPAPKSGKAAWRLAKGEMAKVNKLHPL